MTTMKELKEVIDAIDFTIKLCGATAEGNKKFRELCKAAGDAIMEEQGIHDPDKTKGLPLSTVLGEKSQEVMESLKATLSR